MEGYQELYQKLVAGGILPASLSVEQLFEVASCLVVNGDFAGKHEVYTRMILTHPQSEIADRQRVLIYHADTQRRNGYADLASALLLAIGQPEDESARMEWLQARGQCLLMQGEYAGAIAVQRELVGLLGDNMVSVDLRFYYLQTLVHLKLLAGQADGEARTLLSQMGELLARPDFPTAKQPYSQKSHWCLLGRWHGENGNYKVAVGALWQAYGHSQQVSVRELVVTALLLVYYEIKLGDANTRPSWFPSVLGFYRVNKHRLQPTDVVQYRRYYDVVL